MQSLQLIRLWMCLVVMLGMATGGQGNAAITTVGEWRVSNDASLTIADGELIIESTGRDPWISTTDLPAAQGPFVLDLSMKSTAKEEGQVFFISEPNERFAKEKASTFEVIHDGAVHDYHVPLKVAKIGGLRIDPAKASGKITISRLALHDASGAVVKTWSFKKTQPAVSKHGRLNVLLLLVEDQGAHLGCLGTPGLATPNMDALAQDGVLFRQYFVGYPVCSPSKACIYSGLYSHRNGLINNTHNLFKPASKLSEAERQNPAYAKNQMKPEVPTLAEILHNSGYHMGVSGKLHVSPNEKFPFDEFIAGKNVVGGFIQRAQASGKPWFLFDNAHSAPHRPYVNSDKDKIGVDPAKVKLPAFLPDTPVCRQDWAEYLNGIQLADAEVGRAMADLKASGELENTLVIVMAGDHGPAFQHGKLTPYELGLHVNLIVRAPGGAHGLVTDALANEVDLLPTILDYLGIPLPKPVDGISLRPVVEKKPDAKGHDYVFAEISGRTPGGQRGMEERSVLDGRWHLIVRTRLDEPRMIQADNREFQVWRNRTYRETIRVKDQFPQQYRILTEFDPDKLGGKPAVCELYDLQLDRDEMHDLSNDPAHRAELNRLFEALKTWSRETQDNAAPLPASL